MARTKRADPEHQEQVAFFQWALLREERIPGLKNLYAVANAGAGGQAGRAGYMKAEGVKAGVPDICLAVVSQQGPVIYGSLYIEMKTPTTYPKPHQREWADRLEEAGMKVVRRCIRWQDAAKHCLEYLGLTVTPRTFPELF